MSFHLDMLHRQLPAWPYRKVTAAADWYVFAILLTAIVVVSAAVVIGWARWGV